MKKTTLFLMPALVLGMLLAGCGGGKKSSSSKSTSTSTSGSSSESESSSASQSQSSEESSSSSSEILGDKTYTCTDLPEWITNDGCVIFVWAWEAGAAGSWIGADYTSETSLEFVVPNELQGFLLARCISGTTQPNWDIHDDSVGRIYNQTEDIACEAGVYTYACAQWKEYK